MGKVEATTDRSNQIKLAACNAAVSLMGPERYFQDLLRANVSKNSFDAFKNYWGVARTIPNPDKQSSHKEILRHLRKIKFNSRPTIVDAVANSIHSASLATGVPVSLVSKYACVMHPGRFAPYDKFGKLGLYRYLGKAANTYKISSKIYEDYIRAFDTAVSDFDADPTSRKLVNLIYRSSIKKSGVADQFPREVFLRRTFDKYLMLVGEFSDHQMKKEVPVYLRQRHLK